VTVLMAVHNESRFIVDAINSLFRQTFVDFELLIVDDASTDSTPSIIAGFTDARLRVIQNEHNLGLTASLNVGLGAAFARDYIARLDGDDVARPDRLAQQVAFLDSRPEIGIVGSSRLVVDEAGNLLYNAVALEADREIRWRMLLGNALAHPTVILRRSLLDAHHLRYDESFRTAQDYEMWTRLLMVTQAANLAEPLESRG
jgi:glycosyltransferase involved in cell wall biosynthesis